MYNNKNKEQYNEKHNQPHRKKIFKVAISEILVQYFFVEASSEEEALEYAVEGYDSWEYVLDGNSDVISRKVKIVREGETETEWTEF